MTVDRLAEYRKGVAAFLVGLAGFLTISLPVLSDGSVTIQDVVTTVLALATWVGGTVAVVATPNAPYTGVK